MSDEPLLFTCTHGAEDPERATVPFIPASTAAVSGRRAVVVCTVEGVRVGLPGYAEDITEESMPPLGELITQLVQAGGEIWLCSVCAVKRGITEKDLIDGARIVGAAQIVEALASGRAMSLT